MSELRVDSVKSKGGGAPNLPKGVTISGIATATTLGATQIDVSNVNVSGVVTSATLSGSLLSTGTPTLGLGVTINSSGVAISGVATAGIVSATTLYGDGTNITGVGASIAPLFYQPDPYDTGVLLDAGIGITFNQQVKAGSGNVTLSIANAGVAGTVVENFGVGSSVSISENKITINPTADITATQDYIISYPSGAFTNNEGTDYVGTAYTFQARAYNYQLWVWGLGYIGALGQNEGNVYRSSPVQVPGTNWRRSIALGKESYGIKSDGTLWSWGYNNFGQLGHNNRTNYSSPVQVPGSWQFADYKFDAMNAGDNEDASAGAIKTDGTLWAWGNNETGQLGHNSRTNYSSPVQIPGTTWSKVSNGEHTIAAIKTNGTLWMWGNNHVGQLGQNNKTKYSSPVQVGSDTTWSKIANIEKHPLAIKTDGTMWGWGDCFHGEAGNNNSGPTAYYSSPIQIPGTSWNELPQGGGGGNAAQQCMAIKTDGTLWVFGQNQGGQLGQNDLVKRSSPTQIPGTTWDKIDNGQTVQIATKTDGTLWMWGENTFGRLGQNNEVKYSSPVQIPGTDWDNVQVSYTQAHAIKKA